MNRLLPLGLLLVALPAAAQPATPSATELVEQGVLPLLSGEALTPEQVIGEVRAGLTAGEQAFLEAFTAQGGRGNLAIVRQEGTDNTVTLDQQGGGGHLAAVALTGSGNEVSGLQIGQRNVLGVQITGDANQLGTAAEPGVTQRGVENVYILELNADAQVLAPVVQNGNGNQVVQTGVIGQPFGVEQTGNEMQLIIRHNEGE